MKTRLVKTALFAALTLLAALDSSLGAAERAASPPDHPERLTGSVRSVDARAHTIDLLTGVGYALRVRRVSLGLGARIYLGGAAVEFSHLTPGCIVRTACHHVYSAAVADTVEILAPAPTRRTP